MCIILDAKYKKANLNKVMTKICQYLNAEERKILLILSRKFEDMLDGTLDTWNTTPVYLKLNGDTKLVCPLPYPVLRVHKAMFRKEAKIILSLGVLEETNDSKWGALFFFQTKSENELCNIIK